MISRRKLNAGLVAALASLGGLVPSLAADKALPAAKRLGPPDVEPVVVGNLRIEALHWGRERGLEQDGGYIAAIDVATGKELWILQVYNTDYDPKMERDVQDVFIAGLAVDGKDVIVTDEDDRRFRVDISTRKVSAL